MWYQKNIPEIVVQPFRGRSTQNRNLLEKILWEQGMEWVLKKLDNLIIKEPFIFTIGNPRFFSEKKR